MIDLTNRHNVTVGMLVVACLVLIKCAMAPAPTESESESRQETPTSVTDQASVEEQDMDGQPAETLPVMEDEVETAETIDYGETPQDDDRTEEAPIPTVMDEPEPPTMDEPEEEESKREESVESGEKKRQERESKPFNDRYQAMLRINELTRSIRNSKSQQRIDKKAQDCRDVCELSDSICYSAREICDIAADFPQEIEFRERCDWAASECVAAEDTCRSCR